MPNVSLQTVLVPVRLNVMYTSSRRAIAKPRLDLRGAQYYDGATRTYQPQDVAGGIIDPFLTRNYANNQADLLPGLYLHWSVTDALATLRQSPLTGEGMALPAVPDRWLITRTDTATGERFQWVVESDYLIDPSEGALEREAFASPPRIDPSSALANTYTQFPTPFELTAQGMAQADKTGVRLYPYRFIGRQVPLSEWSTTPPVGAQYLKDMLAGGLTVAGYGEPTFASVFSNSRTVFGVYDVPPDASATYRYDVVGWYGDPTDDCIQNFWMLADASTDPDRFSALEGEYRWAVSDSDGAAFPVRSAYYASLSVVPSAIDEGGIIGNLGVTADLALGNTGSEALAAYLARQVAAGDSAARRAVEAQLEALPILHQLQSSQADVERRFEQLQHRRGFKPQAGGRLWAIRAQPSGSGVERASAMPTQLPPSAQPLPADLASALNRLNLAQSAYDRAERRLSDAREQLFAAWYKFDYASYADPNRTVWHCWEYQRNLADYRLGVAVNLNGHSPSPMVLRQHLMPQMAEVVAQVAELGELVLDADGLPVGVKTPTLPDSVKAVFTDEPAGLAALQGVTSESLAAEVWAAYQAILPLFAAYQQANPSMVLTTTPAARYWQPIEPFVMVQSGQMPNVTDLYGHDGVLSCHLTALSVGSSDPSAPFDLDAIGVLAQVAANLTPDPMQVSAPMYGLVLMEWGVSVRALLGRHPSPDNPFAPVTLDGTRPNPSAAGVDFLESYLEANFHLTETSLDVVSNGDVPVSPTVSEFQGMAVLTDHGTPQLITRAQRYLATQTLLDLKLAALARTQTDSAAFDDAGLAAWYAQQHPSVGVPSYGDDDAAWDTWFGGQYPFADADGAYLGGDLRAWYEASPAYDAAQWALDSVDVYLRALQSASGLNAIGQALGGFNSALLMREQVLQMPVYDLGLAVNDLKAQASGYRDGGLGTGSIDLMSALAALIGGANRSAPNANGYFMPLRTGDMELASLTLVDSFGRVYEVSSKTVAPSLSMTPPDWDDSLAPVKPPAYLAPRLTQPAQTVLHWLSADDDAAELNPHPAASPICGWLMVNALDGSLMVYEADGTLLGAVNAAANWEPAPAAQPPLDAGQIPNLHLREVVKKLIVNALTTPDEAEGLVRYLGNLLAALDGSLARIEPENFAQHRSTALLLGRPVAVVRAQMGVRLMGEVQINQSFAALLSTVYEARECGQPPTVSPFNAPLTNHYEDVRFWLRVGERVSGDGLVGYWREDEDGRLGDVFFAPKAMPTFLSPEVLWAGAPQRPDSDADDSDETPDLRPPMSIAVVSDPDAPTNLLSVNPLDAPHTLTLLLDPRAALHVSAGLLPVEAVSIPSEQYTPALERMSVSFLVAPVLTGAAQPQLPLSAPAGAQWSWLARPNASTWTETPATAPSTTDAPPDHVRGTSQSAVFTPQRLVEGWLKLAHTTDDDATNA
jgi:hypothetical protein